MSVVEAIERFLQELESRQSHFLLALSGGVDSTALAIGFCELKTKNNRISAAHVNHHLRGEESDGDEAYVRTLCEKLGITLVVADGTLARIAIKERGIEAAAREVRYAELRRLARELGADFIVTAHQKDDQAETVLWRLISGTAIARLRGIVPVTDDRIIRPLLELTRTEIDAFLRDRGITPRRDSSNDELRFTRNRIRHEILPLLRQINPQVVSALAETARQTREQEAAFQQILDTVSREWLERYETESDFDLSAMPANLQLRRALLLREIRRLDPSSRDVSADTLTRLARQLPRLKRTSVTKRLELVRSGNLLILHRVPRGDDSYAYPLRIDGSQRVPELRATVRLTRQDRAISPLTDEHRHRQIFQLGPQETTGDFTIRSRRQGDRFRPLGARSEKKLNEFLIDRKIPLEIRNRVPLLTWNGQIVWVGGVEVSDRFKVLNPASEVFEISVHYEEEKTAETDSTLQRQESGEKDRGPR